MKNLMRNLILGAFAFAALSSCGKHQSPYFIYMPDMYWTPGLKYQMPGMKPPVPGTVSRNHFPMPAGMTIDEAGKSYAESTSITRLASSATVRTVKGTERSFRSSRVRRPS
jgi:hypothetical protein